MRKADGYGLFWATATALLIAFALSPSALGETSKSSNNKSAKTSSEKTAEAPQPRYTSDEVGEGAVEVGNV